jgi:hypothetical protein
MVSNVICSEQLTLNHRRYDASRAAYGIRCRFDTRHNSQHLTTDRYSYLVFARMLRLMPSRLAAEC